MKDVLLYFAMKYKGDFMRMFTAIQIKEPIDEQQLKEYKKQVKHKYVTLIDHNYPEYFKSTECPPMVLFYQGNLRLIDKDLPMEYSVLESGKRFISTVDIAQQNGKVVFDYVIATECQEDLDILVEHIKNKRVPLKNYDKPKNKQIER